MPDLIARQDASDLGLTRFCTGRPCSRGHIGDRLISNGGCIACMRDAHNVRRKTRAYKDHLNTHLSAKRAAARELRTCLVCQTPFDIMLNNRLSAKTCSPECSGILQQQRQADKLKKPDRECEHCFELFVSRNSGHVTCSIECREAIDAGRRAARTKTCLQCSEVYNLSAAEHGCNGFCSDECHAKQQVKNRARAHQRLRLDHPEQLRERRENYKIVNAEAHRTTTRNVNARRIQREIEAMAVCQTLIPATLAGIKNYRRRVRTAVEFLSSIGVNHPPQMEKNNVPLR